jgi:hypothetical protein
MLGKHCIAEVFAIEDSWTGYRQITQRIIERRRCGIRSVRRLPGKRPRGLCIPPKQR